MTRKQACRLVKKFERAVIENRESGGSLDYTTPERAALTDAWIEGIAKRLRESRRRIVDGLADEPSVEASIAWLEQLGYKVHTR